MANGIVNVNNDFSGAKQNVVVQKKDPDGARQNLWLSGKNWSGGSVGRTQGFELST
jgi:hypothetical protein